MIFQRKPWRALLVEDDVEIAEATQLLLERFVKSVDIANSFDEAVRLLEENAYDVVIADYDLRAELTGDDLLRVVRARTPYVWRVLTTAYVSVTPEAANALLLKPYTVDELVTATTGSTR